MKPANAGVAVKSAVERENRVDPVAFHDGEVYGIPSGKITPAEDDLPGAQHVRGSDGEYLIDDAEQRVERWLDRVASLNGHIPMEDLLQDLRVGYEPSSVEHAALQELLRIRFVGVRGSHEIHRDVRVDEYQSSTYPRSISASI